MFSKSNSTQSAKECQADHFNVSSLHERDGNGMPNSPNFIQWNHQSKELGVPSSLSLAYVPAADQPRTNLEYFWITCLICVNQIKSALSVDLPKAHHAARASLVGRLEKLDDYRSIDQTNFFDGSPKVRV